MIFERIAIPSAPQGGFLYVLHFEDTNFITIGIGHESRNGLQLTHTPGLQIHHGHVHEAADEIEDDGVALSTGKLAPFFSGLSEIDVKHTPVDGTTGTYHLKLAEAMRRLHDRIWGHPLDWEPYVLDLGDGRTVYIAYGADIDKLRVGIGYINDSDERIFGDTCYAVGKHSVDAWTMEGFERPVSLKFYAVPPRWRPEFPRYTTSEETCEIFVLVRRLANKVWKLGLVEGPPKMAPVDEGAEA